MRIRYNVGMDRSPSDPLLALYGSGKDLWAAEHADDYVRRLRGGWDEAADHCENPEQPPNSPDR
jgi:hypothetical protein